MTYASSCKTWEMSLIYSIYSIYNIYSIYCRGHTVGTLYVKWYRYCTYNVTNRFSKTIYMGLSPPPLTINNSDEIF